MQQPKPARRRVLPVAQPQHQQQADVQRRRLVERFVEAHQQIEHPPEHAIQRRALKAEAQRKQQEAQAGQQGDRQQALGVGIEFGAAGAQKERDAVEQVYAPVRHDGPGPQRDGALPGHRHIAHPLRRQAGRVVIGRAVEQKNWGPAATATDRPAARAGPRSSPPP